ncbi:MAG TPA: hypothetical protein VFG03_16740, partial [Telluria sp.]|nr:hypothetical protein [Telluria sp.]
MSTLKLHATPAGALELVRTNLKAMPRHTYGAVDFAKTEIDEVNIVAYIRVAKATLEIASQKVVLDPDLAHSGVALLDYKSKIVAAAFIDEGTAHDA